MEHKHNPLSGRVCYRCASVILGPGVLTAPPHYLVRSGVEFPRAYHAGCYAESEAEAARELRGVVFERQLTERGLNVEFNFSWQGRRPTARQIVSAWSKAGRPAQFSVEYGETFAEFQQHGARWDDSGNGCRGVDRAAVVHALNTASKV
jgi:hypothetical protein